METILHNVKDIASNDRRSLEHLVGTHLEDNQQVLIHVLDVGVEPSDDERRMGIQMAAAIAAKGRLHAARKGVSSEEADAAIDESIRYARQSRRS
jgi:hypothetical protein